MAELQGLQVWTIFQTFAATFEATAPRPPPSSKMATETLKGSI